MLGTTPKLTLLFPPFLCCFWETAELPRAVTGVSLCLLPKKHINSKSTSFKSYLFLTPITWIWFMFVLSVAKAEDMCLCESVSQCVRSLKVTERNRKVGVNPTLSFILHITYMYYTNIKHAGFCNQTVFTQRKTRMKPSFTRFDLTKKKHTKRKTHICQK